MFRTVIKPNLYEKYRHVAFKVKKNFFVCRYVLHRTS